MTSIQPKFFEQDGIELVVLTRAEFDALIAAAAEAEEDAADVAIFDERMAALAAGTDVVLPAEVSAFMLKGDSLLKALRKWRGMTQMELAFRTGVAQGYISDLEARRKPGTVETLAKIAAALEVDPSWMPNTVELSIRR